METGECSEEYFICIFYSYNSNIIIIIIIIRLLSFCTYYFKQFIIFLFHFFFYQVVSTTDEIPLMSIVLGLNFGWTLFKCFFGFIYLQIRTSFYLLKVMLSSSESPTNLRTLECLQSLIYSVHYVTCILIEPISPNLGILIDKP